MLTAMALALPPDPPPRSPPRFARRRGRHPGGIARADGKLTAMALALPPDPPPRSPPRFARRRALARQVLEQLRRAPSRGARGIAPRRLLEPRLGLREPPRAIV